jgi:hypothetical protein
MYDIVDNCEAGEEINIDGECEPCPVGMYQHPNQSYPCLSCAKNETTTGNGSIGSSSCVCKSSFTAHGVTELQVLQSSHPAKCHFSVQNCGTGSCILDSNNNAVCVCVDDCSGHGTCITDENNKPMRCDCDDNYTGDNCESMCKVTLRDSSLLLFEFKPCRGGSWQRASDCGTHHRKRRLGDSSFRPCRLLYEVREPVLDLWFWLKLKLYL